MTTLGGGGPLSSRSALVADSTPPSPSSRESTDDVSPGGGGGGTIKILINGVRKIYYAPVPPPPEDNAPPAKRPVLEWVFGYRGADQASLANCRNFGRGTGKIIVYRVVCMRSADFEHRRASLLRQLTVTSLPSQRRNIKCLSTVTEP